jgi:hypothetical protein
MNRRPLSTGINPPAPPVDPDVAKKFIRGEGVTGDTVGGSATASKQTVPAVQGLTRVPLSTRIRADFFAALKRASLERQLSNAEPHTLIEILEQAVEPWLKDNGYL